MQNKREHSKGFSIRIFVPDGNSEGLKIIEKSNWSGCGLVCPRSHFSEIKSRKEFDKTGVYILVGPSNEAGLLQVYIGEGDPVKPRIEQHISKKDFWTSLILFTSKDQFLNKAHVQYLEAQLILLALDAKLCELDNGNHPTAPSLSAADESEVDGFLKEMLLLLPVFGLSVFDKPLRSPPEKCLLYLKRKGIVSRGYDSVQGFIVLKGSQAVKDEVPSIHGYVSELRKRLISKGILGESNHCLVFTQDYIFNSPSTSAGVLLGASSNGRQEWKDKSGKSLKEIL